MPTPAPGRYCLAVCYCGECPHYVPLRRTTDPKQRAKAARKPYVPPREQNAGQLDLLAALGEESA